MRRPKLRIIHETNPRKYFPALYDLAARGEVDLVGEHRYSVGKEWLRAWLRDRTPFMKRSRNALGDLSLRLRVPFLRGETIVFGFAPWDWRLLIYRRLARHNRILYQTSWHDWRLDKTPRQPVPSGFKRYMQKQWRAFVNHPNVNTVAVTPVVAETVARETGAQATVIPHAVPEIFFTAAEARSGGREAPLKLLYVGEVSEKKGIRALLKMMAELAHDGMSLSVVGNGPLVGEVENGPDNVTYLGAIHDRGELAQVMGQHDVLMLLSRKTDTWEELFGIVIIEALAAGCAVISSDHVGPRGILAPVDGLGLYAEEAETEIIDQLRRFSTEPVSLTAFAQRQGAVARAYALNAVANQWMTLIAPPHQEDKDIAMPQASPPSA